MMCRLIVWPPIIAAVFMLYCGKASACEARLTVNDLPSDNVTLTCTAMNVAVWYTTWEINGEVVSDIADVKSYEVDGLYISKLNVSRSAVVGKNVSCKIVQAADEGICLGSIRYDVNSTDDPKNITPCVMSANNTCGQESGLPNRQESGGLSRAVIIVIIIAVIFIGAILVRAVVAATFFLILRCPCHMKVQALQQSDNMIQLENQPAIEDETDDAGPKQDADQPAEPDIETEGSTVQVVAKRPRRDLPRAAVDRNCEPSPGAVYFSAEPVERSSEHSLFYNELGGDAEYSPKQRTDEEEYASATVGGQQPTEDGLTSSCVMSPSGKPEKCDVLFFKVPSQSSIANKTEV